MGKTVFILGAGATRGCSFVPLLKQKGKCIPPLDADFFTQLQRVSNPTHKARVNALVTDLVNWFGHNYALSMEQVFIFFEHAKRMLTHLDKADKQEHSDVQKVTENLVQAIAIVLGESLTEAMESGVGSTKMRTCCWHDKMVEDLADKDDSFISFNYDCVLDDSLRRVGGCKWNAKYGYGFKLRQRGKGITGDIFWTGDSSVKKEATIKVHKIHGSIHFHVEGKKIKLKKRPYTKAGPSNGRLRFSIIPPESQKSYGTGVFAKTMRDAYQSLRKASRLVVIGYSLPDSDQHADALLRFGIGKSRLDSLVIANPDRGARRKIRASVQGGLKKSTRILSFDSFEEFVNADKRVWKL